MRIEDDIMDIQTKRIYEKVARNDGSRIYVDRLWARGLTKEAAHLDEWMKDIAPSDELRKWYHHDKGRWQEFKERYYRELEGKSELVLKLWEEAQKKKVTLLFSAKNEECNNAIALKEYLENVTFS
jgi:uncharacterized protein YeaO (DUF488 family)